jgi:hypothetical protein
VLVLAASGASRFRSVATAAPSGTTAIAAFCAATCGLRWYVDPVARVLRGKRKARTPQITTIAAAAQTGAADRSRPGLRARSRVSPSIAAMKMIGISGAL